MDALDSDPRIQTWEYEQVWVMYLDGTKVKKYLPDFLVRLVSGEVYLVEVKPEKLRNTQTNSSKRSAVLQKCEEEKWKYYEWQPGQDILQ